MNGILTAIDLAMSLAQRWQAASALIAKAQSEGRDVTSAELAGLRSADDAAMEDLTAAIAAIKAKGG